MNKIKLWFRAVNPFSFTASITPMLLGGVLAFEFFPESCNWYLLPLVLICGLLYHSGANALNDYCDYKNEVDKDYTYGGSKVIQDGLMKPAALFRGGILMLTLGSILGILFVYLQGLPILIIGIIGLFGAYGYTAKPIGYKYIALGDFSVFIMMGPLMVIGSLIAITGRYSNSALLISLPVGFLVTSILHANNTRDIKHDSEAKIKTIAILLGSKLSKLYYTTLIVASYVTVVILIAANVLSWFSLIVFITLPIAIKNIKILALSSSEKPQEIASIDNQSAQLHLAFGLLLIIAILLQKFL